MIIQIADILAIIEAEPGCKMATIRKALELDVTDGGVQYDLGHHISTLDMLGLIQQDRGGWYAWPATWASTSKTRAEARQAVKRHVAEERAAESAQKRAWRVAQREGTRRHHAQTRDRERELASAQEERIRADLYLQRAARRAEYTTLVAGLTLQRIADICGKSHSAAQAWSEGRSTPPQYAIDALRAQLGGAGGDGGQPDAESVTDLI